ncbi:N-acetylglucosamine-6-sulfatase [Amphibalanus amphitrite]|uniref:N-acetylglucosamine-6-sulfatase n=1 Tax=Amphibalanus amphitrite TaxID=1232801 RepID=A0A6A4W9D8_AMPAM|nr:N-acetylglucosamine-6-sulfatase [Amphibalanus amphitrite]
MPRLRTSACPVPSSALWFTLCAPRPPQFVSTPVCCPSRATLLTGRYQHNTAVRNNTLAGNCCGSDWRGRSEPRTVAALLRQRGYNTFYAGKYLNQVSGQRGTARDGD